METRHVSYCYVRCCDVSCHVDCLHLTVPIKFVVSIQLESQTVDVAFRESTRQHPPPKVKKTNNENGNFMFNSGK